MAATASPTVSSTVGLKNVVIAPLTEDTEATLTYGELQLMAGAIEASVTPENADPDVKSDFIKGMDKFFPDLNEFQHCEGNSDAHIKSSAVGVSETIIITGGNLLLGTWQDIYFCEFDGPRNRKFYVKVM